jgi:hypothetical protein
VYGTTTKSRSDARVEPSVRWPIRETVSPTGASPDRVRLAESTVGSDWGTSCSNSPLSNFCWDSRIDPNRTTGADYENRGDVPL